jgi:hypothetical protein
MKLDQSHPQGHHQQATETLRGLDWRSIYGESCSQQRISPLEKLALKIPNMFPPHIQFGGSIQGQK